MAGPLKEREAPHPSASPKGVRSLRHGARLAPVSQSASTSVGGRGPMLVSDWSMAGPGGWPFGGFRGSENPSAAPTSWLVVARGSGWLMLGPGGWPAAGSRGSENPSAAPTSWLVVEHLSYHLGVGRPTGLPSVGGGGEALAAWCSVGPNVTWVPLGLGEIFDGLAVFGGLAPVEVHACSGETLKAWCSVGPNPV